MLSKNNIFPLVIYLEIYLFWLYLFGLFIFIVKIPIGVYSPIFYFFSQFEQSMLCPFDYISVAFSFIRHHSMIYCYVNVGRIVHCRMSLNYPIDQIRDDCNVIIRFFESQRLDVYHCVCAISRYLKRDHSKLNFYAAASGDSMIAIRRQVDRTPVVFLAFVTSGEIYATSPSGTK